MSRQGNSPASLSVAYDAAWPGPGGQAEDIELVVVRFDAEGRLPLRAVAAIVGWASEDPVRLAVRGKALWLARTETASALTVSLDPRGRVVVPYGIRHLLCLRPGMRVVLLAAHTSGVVAAVSVREVLGALGLRCR